MNQRSLFYAFSGTIHFETNLNFIGITFILYEATSIYTNQKIIKIDPISTNGGEKRANRLFATKSILLRRPLPQSWLCSPASQSLPHTGNDYRYLYPEHQVLRYPLGETTHKQAGTLPYATWFQNFHLSAPELVTPQWAELKYLRVSINAFSSFLFYL